MLSHFLILIKKVSLEELWRITKVHQMMAWRMSGLMIATNMDSHITIVSSVLAKTLAADVSR